MKRFYTYLISGVSLAVFMAGAAVGAEPTIAFGLPHSPLGPAYLNVQNGMLSITEDFESAAVGSQWGRFGVSVELGEADSGLFCYIDTSGSFQGEGDYMVGVAYGQVNGVPDQLICSLRANTLDWNGNYEIQADFSLLGATTVRYEIYHAGRLVKAVPGATAPIFFNCQGSSGPSANPFWMQADGSVAAVVRLATEVWFRVPGTEEEGFTGDEVVIRAEQVNVVVDFASRMEAWAGGGEDSITLTQERLGVFHHPHKALGHVAMTAASGRLTLSKLDSGPLDEETGVSVELDRSRHFSLDVQTQPLPTNAALVASAIAGSGQVGGEFLGYAGVRNREGVLEAFAAFPFFAEGMHVSVYRRGSLVGSKSQERSSFNVGLSGTPGVTRFEATPDAGPIHPGLAVSFDAVTDFSFPDGSSLEGDQVRFQLANGISLDQIIAFSLTCSNLDSFTILGEGGPGRFHLMDYLPETVAQASFKHFIGVFDGEGAQMSRTVARTNVEGQALVVFTDDYTLANRSSATYSVREDGLYFHGFAETPLGLLSGSAVRLLPVEFALGETYFGQALFNWRDAGLGDDYPVEVSVVTRAVTVEDITVQSGTFRAVRLETVTTFAGGPAHAPVACYGTNWLAEGVGVVRFAEQLVFADSTARLTAMDLSSFLMAKTPRRTVTANVAANIVLKADVTSYPECFIQWQKDGAEFGTLEETGTGPELILLNLASTDAGDYSVVASLQDGETLGTMSVDVATVRVIPFSDAPGFWASAVGLTQYASSRATTVDAAGNVYVAGQFGGAFGTGAGNPPPAGSGLICLLKFDSSGAAQWAKRMGSSSHGDYPIALGTDAAGDIYLAGQLDGTTTIGSSTLERGLFVTKMNPSGEFLWTVGIPGAYNLYGSGLAVDSQGNQFLFGYFYGTIMVGSTELVNEDWQPDLFLAKLNADGEFLWVHQVSGQYSVYAGTVILDGGSGVYLTGSFQGEAYFPSGTLHSGANYQAGFLARVDSDGNYLWAKAPGWDIRCLVRSVSGDLYMEGYLENSASSDFVVPLGCSSWLPPFIARLTPEGRTDWARPAPLPASYEPPSLVADSAGNVYLSGGFYDTATIETTTFKAPNYYSSAIYAKFDPNGRYLWYKQLTGDAENWPGPMASDNAGNIYITGRFRTSIHFGEETLSATGQGNVYVAKLTAATAPVITVQPQSQVAALGAPATFSISATGSKPIFYQWRKDGVTIEGATSPSLVIEQARWSDRGIYSATLRNAGGVVISDGATLQVTVPEAGMIAFAEAAYSVVETGAVAVVSVVRSGNTVGSASVDFETAGGTASAGVDYWDTVVTLQFGPGETQKTVTVPIADDPEYEPSETVVLRLCNPGPGVGIGQPDTATLTITDNDVPGMPIIRIQPVSRSVSLGAEVTFSVVVGGAEPLSYQWHKGTEAIAGATSRTFRILHAQFTDAGAYFVVVSNMVGVVVSAEATLQVRPAPVILVQPQSQTVPYAERVTFSVVATSSLPVITHTVQRASSGAGADAYIFPSGGNGTLHIQYDFGNDPDSLTVSVVRDGWEEPSTIFTLTTNGTGQLTVPFGYPAVDQLIIMVSPQGESADGWTYQAEQTLSPLTYRWMRNGAASSPPSTTTPGWDSSMGPTFTIDYVTMADAGNYSVVVSDSIGSVVSDVATLSVTGPLLQIVTVQCPGGEPGCIQIFWKPWDYHLEKLENPDTDEWVDVPDAFSGMILPAAESQTFFRLRRTERVD